MITNYGGVFVATTKAERETLKREGHIVYSQEEFDLAQSVPEIKEFGTILNDLKVRYPEIELVGVRSVRRTS